MKNSKFQHSLNPNLIQANRKIIRFLRNQFNVLEAHLVIEKKQLLIVLNPISTLGSISSRLQLVYGMALYNKAI